MIRLLLLYLFFKASSAENHALKTFTTVTSGLLNFPEHQYSVMVDDIPVVHCVGSNKILEVKYDWLKKLFHDEPKLYHRFQEDCFERWPTYSKFLMRVLKNISDQSEEGVHIMQVRSSTDWDEETQKVSAVFLGGYDGEDFLAVDFETLTWNALQPRAIPLKRVLDTEKARMLVTKAIFTQEFHIILKQLLDKGKSILLRTEQPSLSLLQKSPSSPVSCLATGFYPRKALMFWRKDGEEIHENVDHGEILPNNDGTFQMRVYLNISSISPEDWGRYDCVFQLLDKEENIIKLDEASIRSNRERPSNTSLPIIAAVIALVLVFIAAAAAAAGHVVYKKKIAHENGIQLSERLNPEI